MVKRSSRKNSPNRAAVALGRLGGLKGGKARALKLLPEERSEIARKGARARWAKEKHPRFVPDDFEIQKARFQKIGRSTLARYENRFVASMNGRIVDSDPDLPTLTARLFKKHPGEPVYITKIGGAAAIIGSPLLEP